MLLQRAVTPAGILSQINSYEVSVIYIYTRTHTHTHIYVYTRGYRADTPATTKYKEQPSFPERN